MFSGPILCGRNSRISYLIRYSGIKDRTAVGCEIKREYHPHCLDDSFNAHARGVDHLRDPRTNKGLAFSLEERQILGIHGLQPPRFKTQEEQLALCRLAIDRYKLDINKFLYLSDLQDRNERLFFRLLKENIESLMPIVYTPTVGLACQTFGLIYRRPRGLFITSNDKGYIDQILKNWPEANVRAVCITDGERILGLGDLGANGMGIPIGKLSLYTALGGIPPHQCLPIMLDVGTNNKAYLEDPLYVGLRQPRVTGDAYYELIDEFMEAVTRRYGQSTLIQFEDFANHHAFNLLDRYKESYCTFNDDIQGTAAVVVGGFYAAKRITGKAMSDNCYLFAGAGEAAVGVADLTVLAMMSEGLSLKDASDRIWMADIKGLLTTSRPKSELQGTKARYAKDVPPESGIANLVKSIKPSVLVGASAAAKLFNKEVLQEMGKHNERPVVFALSNPTSKAECTNQEAYDATEGRVIFSSGSPFPPVQYNGKTYKTGQGNNAYIFPGVALGVIATRSHHISEDMFLIAARELSKCVDKADLEAGSLYPPLSKVQEVSLRIAIGVTENAYAKGLASTYPEPNCKREWLEGQLYTPNYCDSLPKTWPWPKPPKIKTRGMEPLLIQK